MSRIQSRLYVWPITRHVAQLTSGSRLCRCAITHRPSYPVLTHVVIACTVFGLLLVGCRRTDPAPAVTTSAAEDASRGNDAQKSSESVVANNGASVGESTSKGTPSVDPNCLSEIPGMADRSNLAPLASLFAKADPSSDPEWRSEQFAVHAGAQLAKFDQLLSNADALTAADLASLFDVDYAGPGLRPAHLARSFDDGVLLVQRAAEKTDAFKATITDSAALLTALRELASIYQAEPGHGVHTKFKIVRVELTDSLATTVSHVEISGPSRTDPHQLAQQNVLWKCRWKIRADADVPYLSSIEASDYEEVIPKSTPRFIEYTEALLGTNASYRDQLRFGADHWYGNLDVAFGIHQGNQGLAVGDANGDGREDLFVCQPAGLPCLFYLQQSDGTLKDVTKEAGLDWLDVARSALFLDFDNDSDQDLAVTLNYSLVIFENLGNTRFFRRTQVDIHSWPSSIAAADFDNDGDLDMYVCGYNPRGETAPGDIFANPVPYHDANNGARNFMLRNDGNWNVSDVTVDVGMNENNRRFTFAAVWEDYDNDNDMDIYVANDFGRKNLYRNELNETGRLYFRDVAAAAGVEDIGAGMSVSWTDYNHDGWMDLYVSNMFSSAGNRITTQQQFKTDADGETRGNLQRHARGNSLFQNLGDGTFRDVSETAAVTLGRWAWGSLFTDINNDGWDDIYVVNGFFTQEDTGDL